jgi:hypothetical protein
MNATIMIMSWFYGQSIATSPVPARIENVVWPPQSVC